MYLAEDQGRFKEYCALKELILQTTQGLALDKARELFQREAAILYQIQHPQIPQFRATFEQDLRLFLVQEYVQGKTYRTLLDERQSQGNAFSQAEVVEFLRQLLPVLAYVHSKGIVHRDIAPDNIILRDRDRLPVLIDFGVVKELASRIQLPDPMKAVTTAGKLGYAPSEQLQSGRAYPSSDLYALAVTVIVLLTGKEPQELFDDIQLSWQWQGWVNVSDGFADVLNRMLSYKPSDRFQSAGEILQALNREQESGQKALGTMNSPYPIPNHPSPLSNSSPSSQIQTIAVVGKQTPVKPNPADTNRPDPVVPQPNNRSIGENPAFIVALGTCVAVVAGFGSWAAVRSFITSQDAQISPTPIFVATPTPTPLPSETPTPLPTPTPTPLPTLTPSASPETYSQRLDLGLGTTISKQGNLKENATVNYIITGEQNQQLTATLNGQGVLMTVLGPDKNPVGDKANRVLDWKGTLPFTGEYTIELRPIRGLPESNYKLAISLEKFVTPTPAPIETPTTPPTDTSTPLPTETPTPTPSISPAVPEFDIAQLELPPSGEPVQVSGITSPQKIKRYLVNLSEEDQVLAVEVLQSAVTLNIRYPNGQLVEDASGVVSWNKPLPTAGLYQIDVIATEETNFTLDVSVRN